MYKKIEDKISKTGKVFILFGILLVFLFFYIGRLISLQIVQGDQYKSKSEELSSQVKIIPAQRGEIFDRSYSLPLVVNTDTFVVVVTPGDIPAGKYDTVMLKLSQILGISKAEIDRKIPKNVRRSFSTIQVKSNVPFSVVSNIAENKIDLPGVSWQSKPIRRYTHTGSLSHIVGYVGDITQEERIVLHNKGYTNNSIVGKTGIEKQYDYLLQGTPGQEMSTVDVRGRVISDTPIVKQPKMGNSLVLTIDNDIQKLCEEALGPRVGATVVLKPASGEILAMASYPYYDTNIFNSDDFAAEYSKLLNDKAKPLINRAVQLSYPPASTFKIIMSTAMLQENAFPATKKIECEGKISYGGRVFHCHLLPPGHGWLDMKNGLAQSCDVYYWTVGRDYLGIEKIASYAKEFGLGRSTEIDLPSQVNGRVPTAEWKQKTFHERWMGGDTMSVSIGQGYVEATPLQLADMVAMVSNAGIIYRPHLLKEVRDSVTGDVIEEIKPKVLTESSIDKEVWTQVQEAMRYTATDGSASSVLGNKTVKIACKTGTGEVDQYKNSEDKKHWHSWLVAYAPYDAPPEDQICVATIVEAVNTWEWWAPYCTNTIIQGIFANQTFEEAFNALGYSYMRTSNVRRE